MPVIEPERPAASTAGTARDVPAGRLWHNADFVKFWTGETVSLFGTQVTYLALPLTAIYTFRASAAEVGVLRFVQLAPYIGLALLFGVWVDRHRRRPVMLWTNVARMALIGLVPVLHLAGWLTMPLLLVIACAVGIASVLFDVSWMPYVPSIVDSRHYVAANAKMAIATSASTVAGPGLAGALVAVLTAPVTLVVDAFSYLFSLVTLLSVHRREPVPPAPPKRHLLAELRSGLSCVFGRPLLAWLAFGGFWANFSMVTVWTIFLLYGTYQLRFSSFTLGLIFTISSTGGVIGALVAERVLGRFPLGLAYFFSLSGLLLGPVVIVAAGGPKLVVAGLATASFFITNLGLGVANVVVVTLRQVTTPQSLMSRMTACFRMLLYGGGAVGGLAAGLLASWLGDKNALVLTAVISALAAAALAMSPVTRLRELPPADSVSPGS
jgi:MFS family permease